MKTYKSLSVIGHKIIPNLEAANPVNQLSPGCYTIEINVNTGEFWFESFSMESDQILDLPSPEYQQITHEMESFLLPETKQKFVDLGYVYKRSALFYGPPGTGKTVLVNRIARDIISKGGIVLWIRHPTLLVQAYQVLNDIQPDTLTGVIFEEVDSILELGESLMLSILDGQIQKNNVIYLATTNFIQDIPPRIYRPGRFSSVIEVKFPILEARLAYLESKLGSTHPSVISWAEASEGLSIDELKEVVQAVYILGNPLEEVLNRIRATKALTLPGEIVGEKEEDEDEDGSAFRNTLIQPGITFTTGSKRN